MNTMHEFHWLLDMLQSVEVGVLVVDKSFTVKTWNGFLENHSGISASQVQETNLFETFPEIPEDWVKRKAERVFQLNTQSYTTWHQRPYLFKFPNPRPITGVEPHMYQNITFAPLRATTGEVDRVCILIYDVTDTVSTHNELERANSQLTQLSQIDQLTKLFNRGTWESYLREEFDRYQRYGNQTAVVMFDIDHFKHVNDTYGHQPGDDILRMIGKTLTSSLRKTDIAGRYGGEEFGVILPETDERGAYTFAERLRRSVEAATTPTEAGDLSCTISIGVSFLDAASKDYLSWLEKADKALYASKESGRNKVTLSTEINE